MCTVRKTHERPKTSLSKILSLKSSRQRPLQSKVTLGFCHPSAKCSSKPEGPSATVFAWPSRTPSLGTFPFLFPSQTHLLLQDKMKLTSGPPLTLRCPAPPGIQGCVLISGVLLRLFKPPGSKRWSTKAGELREIFLTQEGLRVPANYAY
jgi:hypothetical protein